MHLFCMPVLIFTLVCLGVYLFVPVSLCVQCNNSKDDEVDDNGNISNNNIDSNIDNGELY